MSLLLTRNDRACIFCTLMNPIRLSIWRGHIIKLKRIIIAVPAVFLVFSSCVAIAKTINKAGALVCVTDKYTEKELEKGHKLADWVGRCVGIPDNSAAEMYTSDCVGKYEFKPDQSYKASGSCTINFKGSSDHVTETWEEGSPLRRTHSSILAALANTKTQVAVERIQTTTLPTH